MAFYPIETIEARAYRIPTEEPESDGTLQWHSTTMVCVEVRAGGETGLGYTYADAAAATIVHDLLAKAIAGADAMKTSGLYTALVAAIRNNGRCGIASMAVSAVDIALWDLKSKLLDVPACVLLGAARDEVAVYGSGGFTSLDIAHLVERMRHWVAEMHVPRVKMKVGREPGADAERVAAVRRAIGRNAALFVDANGAYAVKQALELARRFADEDVCWLEEPVYHRDLRGNALVRDGAPPSMEVSNGEYCYAPDEFERIIDAKAADVIQADVTRCGGFSGFAMVDAICEAHNVPLSSHCAPYATLHAALAAKRQRHVEYFYDHVRIERMLFDGPLPPKNGNLAPDLSRPGIGLELKRADAARFAA